MLKGKNSLLTKISAIVLVIAVTLSTLPAEFLSVKAAESKIGSVTTVEAVGGEIDSSDPYAVQVKYEGELVIARLGADVEKGRENEGWYVGALMHVPVGMTEFSNAQYRNGDGETISLATAQSLESIYMWQQISESDFRTKAIAGEKLTYSWMFWWDTQDEEKATQEVIFTIDTSKVTLSDEDTVAPIIGTPVVNPSTWTNGNVEITGTVSDNFSGVKAVYYKKLGTTEEQTVIPTGNTYSFTVNAETYEGKYIVWCEDNKGNKSVEVEVDVFMDITAPTIAANADTTDWAKGKVVISGTATDAGSGVKAIYYQKGSEGTKVEVEEFDVSNGTFKATISPQEYQGDYIVSCIDKAGNEAQTIVSVKMDNKVPEIKDVKANIATWTNQAVIISGTVGDTTSGVEAVYYRKGIDGKSVPIANQDGKFEFEIEPQEYDGAYFIYCRDWADNTSSTEVAVKMDNGICTVVTGEASCKDWTNQEITIQGSVFDKTSGVASVSWKKGDGSARGEAVFNEGEDTYSFTVQAQDYEGNYIITCKDKAGNTSLKFEVPVKMDKTAPVVKEATASKTKWTNGAVVIEGTVSDERSGVASVIYKKADAIEEKEAALNIDNTYSITLDPDDYAGNYTIYCIDAAGNKSEGYNVNVKMDKTAPTVETPTVSAETWTNGSIKITGTVSDELSKVGSVTCVKTGTTEVESVTYDDSTGNYEILLEAQNYYGTYTITCEDRAGNATSTTVTVQMDIQKPKLDSITPVFNEEQWMNTAVTITVEAIDPNPGAAAISDIASVFYKKSGETDEQAKEATFENDKFAFEIGAQSYKGTYVIYCIDNAGNRSEDFEISVYMDNEQCKILSAEVTISDWTNEDVRIFGHVWDNLSGIESITYKQENVGTEKSVKVMPVEAKEGFTFSYSITIPKQNYDGNYILTCKDKAGNEMLEAKTVDVKMDIEKPKVVEAQANPSNWDNGVVEISGKVDDPIENGAQSGVVSYTYKKGNSEETAQIEINDDNTFSFKVGPDDYEGTYTIYCIDAAGNKSDGYNVDVKMDNIAPNETTIKCGNSVWKEIVNELTFKLFFNNEQTLRVSTNDNRSGIKTIEYIEKNVAGITELTEDDVKNAEGWEAIYNGKEKETESEASVNIVSTPDKNVVVFVRVTDFAGNKAYVTTDGLIFDTTKPAPALDGKDGKKLVLPETKTDRKVPDSERPLYGIAEVGEAKELVFDVKVTEETVDGVLQSGIQSVTYEIKAKDRATDKEYVKLESGEDKETGTLYPQARDGAEGIKTVYDSTATTNADAKIIVDAEKFNYNYVDLTVTVEDNAGNVKEETYEFAIDITAPTVSIEYDNNEFVSEDNEQGYYAEERTAKITYTERSENWSWGDAEEQKLITALNIKGESIEKSYEIKWVYTEDKEGIEGKRADEDTHIATIVFTTTEKGGKDARYDIDTTYTDKAGNTVKVADTTIGEGTLHPFKFTIDTVSPIIDKIEYNKPIFDTVINALIFNYYDSQVKVTVTAKDETSNVIALDYEGLLDSNISAKNKEVLKTTIEEAKDIKQGDGLNKDTFVIEFKIPQSALTELNSFRGTVKVKAYDYCYNSIENHDNVRLVVDKIAPKVQVTFTDPVKEVNGISYYNGDFTATIVIDEANFYAEDVNVLVNDTRVYPTDWTQNGDVWTSHVTFTGENDYVLKVNYKDRSGNVMTPYESNQKTLDTTDPVIAVSNLKHESANNSKTIGFVLTVTDKNIALADIKPQVTAVVRKGNNSSNYTYENVVIDLGTPTVSTNASGETVYTYTVENLEIDGYYSIVCAATDLANHAVSNISVSGNNGQNSSVETMNFSVNREGSVFWIETEHTDKYTDKTMKDELDGAYANDQVTVKLHEVNVDKVDDSEATDKRTVLTLNDGSESNTIELVENGNGSGNYERNVEIGKGGWYKTTYTLNNEQFENDGTYSLNIITYDKAENSNVNTKSEEGTIKFVVDRTNPVITSNVKNGQSIKETAYTVEFKVADVNLDPTTVVVRLNGHEIECKPVSTDTYQFTVDEAQWKNFPQLSQDFEIEAKDLAGNSAEIYERSKITVTDDVFIQAAAYMINRPLTLGLTATGLVALIGFSIFFVILKRRKEREE